MLELQFSELTLTRAACLAAFNQHGYADISPHTQRWFKSGVASLRAFLGSDVEITAVTPRVIAQWQDHLIATDTPEITANSYLRSLKTMFSRLQKNGTIGHNPAQPVAPLPEPRPGPKAINQAHYQAMREPAGSSRNIAIIDTLWSTGCRAGELVAMDISKVERWQDENGRYCAAVQVKGKLKNIRWVYWKEEQAESLIRWLSERPSSKSAALFTTATGRQRFTLSGFSTLIRQIRITANVLDANTNPHAFRHAFAIRKLDEGYDLATVSQWLGHSNPEFTASVYAVRTEAELRKRFFVEP